MFRDRLSARALASLDGLAETISQIELDHIDVSAARPAPRAEPYAADDGSDDAERDDLGAGPTTAHAWMASSRSHASPGREDTAALLEVGARPRAALSPFFVCLTSSRLAFPYRRRRCSGGSSRASSKRACDAQDAHHARSREGARQLRTRPPLSARSCDAKGVRFDAHVTAAVARALPPAAAAAAVATAAAHDDDEDDLRPFGEIARGPRSRCPAVSAHTARAAGTSEISGLFLGSPGSGEADEAATSPPAAPLLSPVQSLAEAARDTARGRPEGVGMPEEARVSVGADAAGGARRVIQQKVRTFMEDTDWDDPFEMHDSTGSHSPARAREFEDDAPRSGQIRSAGTRRESDLPSALDLAGETDSCGEVREQVERGRVHASR